VVVYHIKGIDSIFPSALSTLVVLSVTVPSSAMALMTERRNEESIKNKNHMIYNSLINESLLLSNDRFHRCKHISRIDANKINIHISMMT
jgi:hypothetical protein